jgi:hypothetical protein
MKAQAILRSAMSLGPYLKSMLLSRQDHLDDGDSPTANVDTTALPGAVIRSAAEALEAHSSQPAMVKLGPMLTLLMMSRSRGSRHHRVRWQGPALPPGCVMVVRYESR